eukprot:Partr_v1_DN24516_c1_g1_i1_m19661 putative Pfam:YbaK
MTELLPLEFPLDCALECQQLIRQISKIYSHPVVSAKFVEWLISQKSAIHAISDDIPATVQRVISFCQMHNLAHQVAQVETDYYSWSLAKRACRLRAPSCDHLCKSLIFENTRSAAVDCSDKFNSRYYCVIVQYTARLNTEKLAKYIREELGPRNLGKKFFNMRIAPEEVSDALTGFAKNGVTPFAMHTDIPVIVDKAITKLQPAVLYLGAGHIDWKVVVSCEQAVACLNAAVAD